MSEADPASGVRTPIQAIDRAVGLLTAVARSGQRGGTLKELSDELGLPASTARTLLSSLAAHGIVDQDAGTRRYLLGSRLNEFTRTYVARADLAEVAAPILRRLWQHSGETVHLSVLQRGRRVDITVLVGQQLLNVNPTAAARTTAGPSPLYRTAAGKVLLAGLDDDGIRALVDAPDQAAAQHSRPTAEVLVLLDSVRTGGFATNIEEEAAGVCGVAAPVIDSTGEVTAALCVGYPAVRHSDDYLDRLRSAVLRSADEVSQRLGGWSAAAARAEVRPDADT